MMLKTEVDRELEGAAVGPLLAVVADAVRDFLRLDLAVLNRELNMAREALRKRVAELPPGAPHMHFGRWPVPSAAALEELRHEFVLDHPTELLVKVSAGRSEKFSATTPMETLFAPQLSLTT